MPELELNTTPPRATERRQHRQLRNVFGRAYALVAPMIAGNGNVMPVSSFAMTHILADRFPKLPPSDILIAIVMVEKLYRQGQLHTNPE